MHRRAFSRRGGDGDDSGRGTGRNGLPAGPKPRSRGGRPRPAGVRRGGKIADRHDDEDAGECRAGGPGLRSSRPAPGENDRDQRADGKRQVGQRGGNAGRLRRGRPGRRPFERGRPTRGERRRPPAPRAASRRTRGREQHCEGHEPHERRRGRMRDALLDAPSSGDPGQAADGPAGSEHAARRPTRHGPRHTRRRRPRRIRRDARDRDRKSVV